MAYSSVFKPGLFDKNVILVTGAGSGIGRCTAHELASLGALVMVSGRTQEKLDKTVSEIQRNGGKAESMVCDIREEEQVVALIRHIVTKHGRLDSVVNNAGGQFPSRLEKLSKNGWDAVVRNNLTGTFLVCREAVNQVFSKVGPGGRPAGGVIVNVTADFRNGMVGMGHSGAARAGVDNLTKTASIEWARFGVRINAVAPGIVESSGLDNYEPAFVQVMRKNTVKIPLKRLSTESEISAPIVFLLSPSAAYITGATLPIDGGLSLRGHVSDLSEYAPTNAYDGFSTG